MSNLTFCKGETRILRFSASIFQRNACWEAQTLETHRRTKQNKTTTAVPGQKCENARENQQEPPTTHFPKLLLLTRIDQPEVEFDLFCFFCLLGFSLVCFALSTGGLSGRFGCFGFPRGLSLRRRSLSLPFFKQNLVGRRKP